MGVKHTEYSSCCNQLGASQSRQLVELGDGCCEIAQHTIPCIQVIEMYEA